MRRMIYRHTSLHTANHNHPNNPKIKGKGMKNALRKRLLPFFKEVITED